MSYQTALVTGASSGIGRGLALALARRGTRVYVAARRRDRLRALVEEIEQAGGQAEAIVLDVADADATCEAVRALDERDPLDLVIANAGVGTPTPTKRAAFSEVKQVLDVNLLGAVATLYGALPGMVARDRGHLVGIASLAGFRGLPKFNAYSASKAALITFLESMRVDLHRSEVAVTTICPGFVRTEMTGENGKLPFLVECDDAVATILGAIDRRQAVCAFPLPTATAMRSVALLPESVYEFLITRAKLPY
jgi:short-subunit dehydrogenase